jgi:hypothetical protein
MQTLWPAATMLAHRALPDASRQRAHATRGRGAAVASAGGAFCWAGGSGRRCDDAALALAPRSLCTARRAPWSRSHVCRVRTPHTSAVVWVAAARLQLEAGRRGCLSRARSAQLSCWCERARVLAGVRATRRHNKRSPPPLVFGACLTLPAAAAGLQQLRMLTMRVLHSEFRAWSHRSTPWTPR